MMVTVNWKVIHGVRSDNLGIYSCSMHWKGANPFRIFKYNTLITSVLSYEVPVLIPLSTPTHSEVKSLMVT